VLSPAPGDEQRLALAHCPAVSLLVEAWSSADARVDVALHGAQLELPGVARYQVDQPLLRGGDGAQRCIQDLAEQIFQIQGTDQGSGGALQGIQLLGALLGGFQRSRLSNRQGYLAGSLLSQAELDWWRKTPSS
jgi:hypothetical protein